eukprot:GHVL01044702.1.p1 GENE.GHVL01044702.1~~GHVL01044702.1.p1  ORF type:complete len:374 (+),score=62.79 GHVL01044702.1:64-1185(+)
MRVVLLISYLLFTNGQNFGKGNVAASNALFDEKCEEMKNNLKALHTIAMFWEGDISDYLTTEVSDMSEDIMNMQKDAETYFKNRFGLDFNSLNSVSDENQIVKSIMAGDVEIIRLVPYKIQDKPQLELISTTALPHQLQDECAVKMHDVGWMAEVVSDNPVRMNWGGSYIGASDEIIQMKNGEMVFYGLWKFDTAPSNDFKTPMTFMSREPQAATVSVGYSQHWVYDVNHPTWGPGIAMGITQAVNVPWPGKSAANPCAVPSTWSASNPCSKPTSPNPCSPNPCAPNPCSPNPCSTNPCAQAPNPCAQASNPCSGAGYRRLQSNPCGSNPCGGGGSNPCGGAYTGYTRMKLTGLVEFPPFSGLSPPTRPGIRQ